MTRLLAFACAMASLTAACGNTGGSNGTADLAVARDLSVSDDLAAVLDFAVPPDLTPPEDLTPPPAPDLASAGPFCRNTPVAGTCAGAFFEAVAKCYQPFGGCTIDQPSMFEGTICWGSGSKLSATFNMQLNQSNGVWSAGLKECMTGEIAIGGGAPVFTLHANGKTLVYEEDTGATTCPDGSRINIGAMAGNCQALLDIIEPDTQACKMGQCR